MPNSGMVQVIVCLEKTKQKIAEYNFSNDTVTVFFKISFATCVTIKWSSACTSIGLQYLSRLGIRGPQVREGRVSKRRGRSVGLSQR